VVEELTGRREAVLPEGEPDLTAHRAVAVLGSASSR
jgi:hypothetical protein